MLQPWDMRQMGPRRYAAIDKEAELCGAELVMIWIEAETRNDKLISSDWKWYVWPERFDA